MAICRNCGRRVKDGNSFCTKCGARMDDYQPAPDQYQQAPGAYQQPPVTDAYQQPRDQYQQVPYDYQQPEPYPYGGPPKKKSNALLIVAIVVTLVAALSVAAVFMIYKSKSDEKIAGGDGDTEEFTDDGDGEEQGEPEPTPYPADAVEYDGHHYIVVNDGGYWSTARARCEEQGGHLATVTSQDEQDFVLGLIESQGRKRNYWLGASDAETEGDWRWVTGESWGYVNWKSNQPDNRNTEEEDGDQNYLQICAASKQDTERYGLWYDMSNSGISHGYEDAPYYKNTEDTGYVCEWEE